MSTTDICTVIDTHKVEDSMSAGTQPDAPSIKQRKKLTKKQSTIQQQQLEYADMKRVLTSSSLTLIFDD